MDLAIIFLGILVIPCILFAVTSAIYNKYKDVNNTKKLSGFEIAREILDDHNLEDVYIVEVKGNLNDHYDYDQKVLRLSSDVFHGESVTSAVVAARIANYAIQDKDNYTFMKFRSSFNKVITFVNYIAYILFLVALCVKDIAVMKTANIAIVFVFIFHIVTLPVEYDVCRRTIKELKLFSILDSKDIKDADILFKISPYTFIVSIITCVSNLISEIMYNIQRRG